MALRVKTVEYAFPQRFTPFLPTNTTLATSGRFDTANIQLTIPETASRTFRSVHLEISWRDAFSAAVNVSGWRIGIKLNNLAPTDTDYTPTALTNTSDHECSKLLHDVTAYFVSNFGTETTQSCVASFALSTASISAATSICIKLIITYEYDDAASTLVKTVRIPMQSHHALLTTAQVEIGTTAGVNNAPANQWPLLDTFLPENNKVIKNLWVETFGNDAGAAATHFSGVIQIDSATEIPRGQIVQSLNTGTMYWDTWVTRYITALSGTVDDGTFPATNAAHAFKFRSTLTNRFDTYGGVIYVTYTYDASSARIINSMLLGIDANPGWVGSTTAADRNHLMKTFLIEEPGIISGLNSAIVMFPQSSNGATFNVLASGHNTAEQSTRAYTLTALVNSGGHAVVHRIDHSNGMAWNRGTNYVHVKIYTSAASTISDMSGSYVIINYTSDKMTAGEGAHNHTTSWFITNQITGGAGTSMTEIATTNQRTPNIPETNYVLNGTFYDMWFRFGAATNGIIWKAQRLTGEFQGEGWQLTDTHFYQNDGELSSTRFTFAAFESFNRYGWLNQNELNIETARKYRLETATAGFFSCNLWVTYYTTPFIVSGILTGYTGNGTGINVGVHQDSDGQIVNIGTSVSGLFSLVVPDNTINYFAQAYQDGTHLGRSDIGTAYGS